MEALPQEKNRTHAKSIAKISFTLSLITLCLAILFPFYCFLLVTPKDQENDAVAAIGSIVNSNWPFSTLTNVMTPEERTSKVTLALMLNIAAFLLAAIHCFIAVLLLKGTDKNLKPNDAIEFVQTHQRIQYIFLFAEASLVLIATFVPQLHDLFDVIGWEYVYFASILRYYCISTVGRYDIDLANEIRMSENKSQDKYTYVV